jgi:hypothetical protein
MFQNELVKIRKGMMAENLSVICENLDAADIDSSLKLGKLDNRLHILEERVAAAARTVALPAGDNQNNGTEVSAPARLSSSRMGTEGSRHSGGRCESECDSSHVDRDDVLV